MIEFHYKRVYLKAFARLDKDHQKSVEIADDEIQLYCKTGEASFGLRVKKLRSTFSGGAYEARVTQYLRIVWVRSENVVSFVLLGNHEDVITYLKNS